MAAAWLGEAVAALEAERAKLGELIVALRRYGGDGLAFHPDAFAMATADLLPPSVAAPAITGPGTDYGAGEAVTVLRGRSAGLPINRNEERAASIRTLLADRGPLSTKAIADTLGSDKSIVKQALQRLQKAGELERSGATASSRWQLPIGARRPTPRTLADVVEASPVEAPAVEDGTSAAALSPELVAALDRSILETLKAGSASVDHLARRMPAAVQALPVSDGRKALNRALSRLEKMAKKVTYDALAARWKLRA